MTESVTAESGAGQRREFRLPDVGEGLTEADIVTWRVKPGDTVTVNQIIVDIETAKAVVELPSPYAGVVAALLVPEGQTVDVGTPIIAVDVPGAAPQPGGPAPAVPPAPAAVPPAPAADPAAIAAAGPRPSSEDLIPPVPPAEERQAVLVGYGVKAGATTRRARKAPAGNGSVAETAPASDNGAAGGHASVLAKPPVRKLARELGVDLAGLAGSGPGGSITRDDVQRAAAAAPAQAPAPAVGWRRPGRSGFPSGACASTPRPRWPRARGRPRTSPSSCRSTCRPRSRRRGGCGTCRSSPGSACRRCCWWPGRC